jgi:carbonic anhydrase/SulP family sulfate permease
MATLSPRYISVRSFHADFSAGIVVFLVALPLCLGIALASGAPMFSGIITGVIGGILVGFLSGSHTSVSGPAAGLTAIVASQIAALGSFEAFLTAVVIAGVMQIVLGFVRGGFIAAFFPNSVIKGLLAAIGLILVMKQIPHMLGHDPDAEGEMSFFQADQENTLSELIESFFHIQPGAAAIGILSFVFLLVWDRTRLKKSIVPAPLLVVVGAVLAASLFSGQGKPWLIDSSHLVQVPVFQSWHDLLGNLMTPDWSFLTKPSLYSAALLIAAVASLETLLNIEAVDKIDRQKRHTPPDRELVAQGVGNLVCGLCGGLPMTSVIVRSSVNINAGGRTRLSAVLHGIMLLLCVLLIPTLLNRIPLSCLAAILIATGLKLASPVLFRQMWREGRSQFLPFIITIGAIFFTDLLIGTLVGLGTAIVFILHSNYRRPLHQVMEHHVAGDLIRIQLADQVSFLNRGVLTATLATIPDGSQVLLDARHTDYIDPDVLDLIDEFRTETAPAHNIRLNLVGFKERYPIGDHVEYIDFTTREVQSSLTPEAVLEILKRGNVRFVSGQRLTRDLSRQVDATSSAQFPMAVVLSCIDSRSPVEIIFDLGLGDAFVIRIAGNVAKEKVLASMEFGCAVAGAKLIVVMGHTSCGAVKAAVELFETGQNPAEATGCQHLDALVGEIQKAIAPGSKPIGDWVTPEIKSIFVDNVSRRNVLRTLDYIRNESETLGALEKAGKVRIVGAIYNIKTGVVDFLDGDSKALTAS